EHRPRLPVHFARARGGTQPAATRGSDGSMTVPGPRSSTASIGLPPCAGQYGLNVQKSHNRPGRGRKSSRAQALAMASYIAVVRRSTPVIDGSVGVAMIASGFDR